jgi:hypothetical protein
MPAPELPEPEPGLGPIAEPRPPLPGPDVLPDPLPHPDPEGPSAPKPDDPVPRAEANPPPEDETLVPVGSGGLIDPNLVFLAANPSPDPAKPPDKPVPRPDVVPPRPGAPSEVPGNPPPGPMQPPPPEPPAPPAWAGIKVSPHVAAPIRRRWQPDPLPAFLPGAGAAFGGRTPGTCWPAA